MNKKSFIQLIFSIVGTGSVLMILVMAFGYLTFGWFSSNLSTTTTGMGVVVQCESYEIYIKTRTHEFEKTHEVDDEEVYVYQNIDLILDMLEDDDYSLTEQSSHQSAKLALELSNEFEFEDNYFLMPGSYGVLEFYIRPKEGQTSLVANLSLDLEAIDIAQDLSIQTVESEKIINLLKGHFLFFKSRTGATPETFQYGDLLLDNTLVYDIEDHEDDIETIDGVDYYKVVLYWEWPLDYNEIVDNTSTNSVTKKYPIAIADYVDDNRNYFFATSLNSNVIDELSDGYNDGDQLIGEGIDFLLVYISAE